IVGVGVVFVYSIDIVVDFGVAVFCVICDYEVMCFFVFVGVGSGVGWFELSCSCLVMEVC
ncbi:hypothetical protein, partial [Klebsiella pneumoniae]|uniref:hypothetical protein n=1 Tax=Klebsiella pneumoniae TaxID=573 RepID=UPI0039C4817F